MAEVQIPPKLSGTISWQQKVVEFRFWSLDTAVVTLEHNDQVDATLLQPQDGDLAGVVSDESISEKSPESSMCLVSSQIIFTFTFLKTKHRVPLPEKTFLFISAFSRVNKHILVQKPAEVNSFIL